MQRATFSRCTPFSVTLLTSWCLQDRVCCRGPSWTGDGKEINTMRKTRKVRSRTPGLNCVSWTHAATPRLASNPYQPIPLKHDIPRHLQRQHKPWPACTGRRAHDNDNPRSPPRRYNPLSPPTSSPQHENCDGPAGQISCVYHSSESWGREPHVRWMRDDQCQTVDALMRASVQNSPVMQMAHLAYAGTLLTGNACNGAVYDTRTRL